MKHALKNKTVLITGASRGIGKAIALRFAEDGANIVILAKTQKEHPKLEGTIFSAAEEIKRAGANAVLPIACDIRSEEQVKNAIAKTIEKFGGIDVLVNNASAINLSGTEDLSMKVYDLMQNVNTRGTFLCSKLCVPYLKNSKNPHILTISPPPSLDAKWYKGNVGYTIAKMGMSLCCIGMSEEFREDGIAVNCLWPRTAIATAAVKNLLGGEDAISASRTVEIMADAAYEIVTSPSISCTGNFFVDDEVLAQKRGFSEPMLNAKYNVTIGEDAALDFFLEPKDQNVRTLDQIALSKL